MITIIFNKKKSYTEYDKSLKVDIQSQAGSKSF